MSKTGVFVDDRGNYYTCCCRAKITKEYIYCPTCRGEVIPDRDRYAFTHGQEIRARVGRAYATYEENRGRADRIAARLRGERYVAPSVCHYCCKSVYECECNQYSTEW